MFLKFISAILGIDNKKTNFQIILGEKLIWINFKLLCSFGKSSNNPFVGDSLKHNIV